MSNEETLSQEHSKQFVILNNSMQWVKVTYKYRSVGKNRITLIMNQIKSTSSNGLYFKSPKLQKKPLIHKIDNRVHITGKCRPLIYQQTPVTRKDCGNSEAFASRL